MKLPVYADIAAAVNRISGLIVKTPLLESPLLNQRVGGRVLVKAEPLQKTGSFKFRGATNAVMALPEGVAHVVAYSSGNHAAAVAAAASLKGIKATIIMPEDAPSMKIKNTKAFGADVVLYDRYRESREAIGQKLADDVGAALIPPYEYIPVIAGQGTMGVEIAQDLKANGITPDQLVCCTGGGGLLAGVALAMHEHFPKLPLMAAEPADFDDFRRSLEAGERLSNDPSARSICDAIVTPTPGEMTFAVNREHVAQGFQVTDEEVLHAIALAWQYLKLVIEPGGAVALTSVLTGKCDGRDKTTVVIASGGNVDPAIFRQALETLPSD
jgi:threonine dehydratase